MEQTEPEQVFTAVDVVGGVPMHHPDAEYRASLRNVIGTQKWECPHVHEWYDKALACAERQRSLWVSSNKASP